MEWPKTYSQNVKHIFIQPPLEDTVYNEVLKTYFYLKKGFIVLSKFCYPFYVKNAEDWEWCIRKNITNLKSDISRQGLLHRSFTG